MTFSNSSLLSVYQSISDCLIDVNHHLRSPQPLLLNSVTGEFLEPQLPDGKLYLDHRAPLHFYCSDGFTCTPQKRIKATCLGDQTFLINGTVDRTLSELICLSHTTHAARRTTSTCFDGCTEIEIGFPIEDTSAFLSVMKICHDEILQRTHYSEYILKPTNYVMELFITRPKFAAGVFFNGDDRSISNEYSVFHQKEIFERHMGPEIGSQMIVMRKKMYLARGHLMARADLIFGAQQRATFYYVNAAPQWHIFNDGNWKKVETIVRRNIAKMKIIARVFTGTYGILRLQNASDIGVDIYLGTSQCNRFSNSTISKRCDLSNDSDGLNWNIPVPLYFYKIVIDQTTGQGVAFVGVNNPYISKDEISKGNFDICKDVTDRSGWSDRRWDRMNSKLGYSYACDVNELAAVVGHLPKDVKATGLLIRTEARK